MTKELKRSDGTPSVHALDTERIWREHGAALRAHVQHLLSRSARGRVAPDAIVDTVLLEVSRASHWHAQALTALSPDQVRKILFRLAGYRLVDEIRRQRRRREEPLEPAAAEGLLGASSPSGEATRVEASRLLVRALERLEPTLREVVRRHALRGESFPFIAATLGIEPDTARKRFQRGLDRLRWILRRSFPEIGDRPRPGAA